MSFCCGADEELYAALLERFLAVPVKIKYVGDRDEVVIAATGQTVKRLGVVEVPKDIADANCAGPDFVRVPASKEKTSPPKSETTERPAGPAGPTPETPSDAPPGGGDEPKEKD